MATISKERLAEVFVEVADTLVGDYDLVDFLHMVTSYTSDLVEARAAGLLLAGPQGRLQLMAASDERAQMVELFQVQAHEGPCQDCYRTGEPVVNADLSAAVNRWPQFAPRAAAAGYRSVHAFPLKLRDQVIGALNLFGTEVGYIDPADVRVVQSLADVATIGILQERAIRNSELLTEQLRGALNSRVVIEQAKGVLAQIHGVTPDEYVTTTSVECASPSPADRSTRSWLGPRDSTRNCHSCKGCMHAGNVPDEMAREEPPSFRVSRRWTRTMERLRRLPDCSAETHRTSHHRHNQQSQAVPVREPLEAPYDTAAATICDHRERMVLRWPSPM